METSEEHKDVIERIPSDYLILLRHTDSEVDKQLSRLLWAWRAGKGARSSALETETVVIGRQKPCLLTKQEVGASLLD